MSEYKLGEEYLFSNGNYTWYKHDTSTGDLSNYRYIKSVK